MKIECVIDSCIAAFRTGNMMTFGERIVALEKVAKEIAATRSSIESLEPVEGSLTTIETLRERLGETMLGDINPNGSDPS